MQLYLVLKRSWAAYSMEDTPEHVGSWDPSSQVHSAAAVDALTWRWRPHQHARPPAPACMCHPTLTHNIDPIVAPLQPLRRHCLYITAEEKRDEELQK